MWSFDNLRLGVISQPSLNMMGIHCGISIGEDGPSQMALEDIAMFRSLPGCTLFYPSDAVACEMATQLAANTRGVNIIRNSLPLLYFLTQGLLPPCEPSRHPGCVRQ